MFFEHPRLLFLLLAIIPLIFLFRINLKQFFSSFLFIFCKDEGAKKKFLLKMNARAALFAVAFFFAVVGAAGPFIGTKDVTARKRAAEVVFAFDISRSMLCTDILPSRLDYAAACAKSVAAGIAGTSCAVVLIKGDAVLALPLTPDSAAQRGLLDALSPNLLTSAGTNISGGINAAAAAFSADRDCAKFLILFTDGGEEAASLAQAANRLREEEVSLIAVGTATKEGAEINMYPTAPDKGRVRTALNDLPLQRAVRGAGLASLYIRAAECTAGEAAARILAALPDEKQGGFALVKGASPVNRRGEFFALALFCFAAGVAAGLYYRNLVDRRQSTDDSL